MFGMKKRNQGKALNRHMKALDRHMDEVVQEIRQIAQHLEDHPRYAEWNRAREHNNGIFNSHTLHSFSVNAELIGETKLYKVSKVFLPLMRCTPDELSEFTADKLLEEVPPSKVGDKWLYLPKECDWFELKHDAEERYKEEIRKHNEVALPKAKSVMHVDDINEVIDDVIGELYPYIPKADRYSAHIDATFAKRYGRKMTNLEFLIMQSLFKKSNQTDEKNANDQ